MIVRDVHKFVIRHPSCSWVFPGWTSEQLMWHLAEAMRDGNLYVCVRSDDEIFGVIIAKVDREHKEIHVSSIIAPESFAVFVRKWMSMYPDYTVIGQRSGKTRRYKLSNFQRFLNHERSANPVFN